MEEKPVNLGNLKTIGDLFDLKEVGRIEITFETKGGKSLKKQSIVLDEQDLLVSVSADIVNQTASIMHPKKISAPIEFTLKIMPVDLEERYGEFKPKF
jgi:hypothetical protein